MRVRIRARKQDARGLPESLFCQCYKTRVYVTWETFPDKPIECPKCGKPYRVLVIEDPASYGAISIADY